MMADIRDFGKFAETVVVPPRHWDGRFRAKRVLRGVKGNDPKLAIG